MKRILDFLLNLCVDSHQSYIKIPTVFNVKLKRIDSGRYTDGIYHI